MMVPLDLDLNTLWFSPDVPDDPGQWRWRAYWCRAFAGDCGIEVCGHKVARVTPKGAWIRRFSWQSDDGDLRWVSNEGRSAWAKPTRQEALHSLAYRLERWSGKLLAEVEDVLASADALDRLAPDLARFSGYAREHLRIALHELERKAT